MKENLNYIDSEEKPIERKILIYNNIACMLQDDDFSNVSDGDHTFSELYHHRAVLTACLFNFNKQKCWKSKSHDTGDMFDGYFIVGMETHEGQATYHYPNDYWDMFDVKELERAPKWDGHTAEEAIERIRKEIIIHKKEDKA